MEKKYCRFCGTEISVDSLFCSKCGKAVHTQEKEKNISQSTDGQENGASSISIKMDFNNDWFAYNSKKILLVALAIILTALVIKILFIYFDRPWVGEVEDYIRNGIDPNSYVTWNLDYDEQMKQGFDFFYDQIEVVDYKRQKDGSYIFNYEGQITNGKHKLLLDEEIAYTKDGNEWVPGNAQQKEIPVFGPSDESVCKLAIDVLLEDFAYFDSSLSSEDCTYKILSQEDVKEVLPNKYVRGYSKGMLLQNLGLNLPFEEDVIPEVIKIDCDATEKTNYMTRKGTISIYAVWSPYHADLNNGYWDTILTDELLESDSSKILSSDYMVEWNIEGKYSIDFSGNRDYLDIQKIEGDLYKFIVYDEYDVDDEWQQECVWDNNLKYTGSIWPEDSAEIRVTPNGIILYELGNDDFRSIKFERISD